MWILLIIAGIGYKPVNISQMLLSEIDPQKKHIYLSGNDTISATQRTTDRSWMLTEPLGGVVGGGAGVIVGAGVGALGGYLIGKMANNESFSIWGYCIGGCGGWVMGIPLGTYYTGKWVEREEGHFKSALIGSVIGSIGSAILFYVSTKLYPYEELGMNPYIALPIPFLPIAGSIIGYRLSLPHKKQ